MVASAYGKYILISRPRYDEERGVWVPYASVVGDGDGPHSYYRQFKDPNSTFAREEQARTFGFIVARAWVDEYLSTQRKMHP